MASTPVTRRQSSRLQEQRELQQQELQRQELRSPAKAAPHSRDALADATSTTTTTTATTTHPTPPAASSRAAAFFASVPAVYGAAVALRLVLLLYGLWQDARSPVKYTDIDYLVFTDAARFVAKGHGEGPYARETYRYTPLLAWLLLPAGTEAAAGKHGWVLGQLLFASGKVLFAAADLLAGWLLERVLAEQLRAGGEDKRSSREEDARWRARAYASVWLLNPMVAAISTRGSAEGLLGALVAALLWAAQVARSPLWTGLLLGCGVHLKIYPFIYAPAIVWWMDAERMGEDASPQETRKGGRGRGRQAAAAAQPQTLAQSLLAFVTPARLRLAAASLATFLGLNAVMYSLYGFPFLQHTYLHHVTRIDHRHNFSPYNTQLYLSSSAAAAGETASRWLPPAESLAFLPQLLLSTVLLPLVLAKKDLATTMLAQTFAFVAFNKVCTSQYFLWYMVLLPAYLPRSSFLRDKTRGLLALGLWVAGQAAWLQQGFALEFLGQSTFVPGLWLASVGFFLVNCWILGVIVGDAAGGSE